MGDLQQYGFLGPLVGIAGTFLAAAAALIFGWSHTLDKWKPPESVMPEALGRMVALLSVIGIFVAWVLAEPGNRPDYLRWSLILGAAAVVAFLGYVGLRQFCGRYRKPVMANGAPAGDEQVWGGFWKTAQARAAVADGSSLQEFLAGNGYHADKTWPPASLTSSAILSALTLIIILVGGTLALTTVATATQVVLTGKPARAVIFSGDVPGLPSSSGGE